MDEHFSVEGTARAQASAAAQQVDATAELAKQVGELAEVIREMRATGDRVDRRGRWTSGVGAFLVTVLMVGMVITISGVNERNDRAEQSAKILEAIRANQVTITDCTTPGHPCYDENQARSNQRLAPMFAVLCATLEPKDRKPPCPTTP